MALKHVHMSCNACIYCQPCMHSCTDLLSTPPSQVLHSRDVSCIGTGRTPVCAPVQVRPHQQWLQDALDTLEPQLMALAPTELSSCLQVLGQWGFTASKSFMQQFHAAAQQHLQHKQLSSRNIASMVWALAQLNNPQQPLLEELLQAAGSMLAADVHRGQQLQQQTCDPQLPSSLADLVWAVAKLQHHPGTLVAALCSVICRNSCASTNLWHLM